MASGNESQGLKIAVAVLVALTVMLLVGTYFVYSEYSKASEQLAAAKGEASQKATLASNALRDMQSIRDRAGYTEQPDAKSTLDQITKDQEALVQKVSALHAEITAALDAAQKAGANPAELERLRGNLDQQVRRWTDESTQSPTLRSSLDTAIDLAVNQGKLSAALALDDILLRGQLGSVDRVNKDEMDVQTKAVQDAKADLNGQIAKYEAIRQSQAQQLDTLQTVNLNLTAERDSLLAKVENDKNSYDDDLNKLRSQINDFRKKAEKTEVVMDVPDGKIRFVDFSRNEVLIDVTRRQGAKPQMVLSIFDKDSPGLPTEKPKGRVQLIQVGESQSIGKILETFDPRNPIRNNDLVYSPTWSPSDPQQIALIGKIDMNRDGRDDREDLRKLIEAAGGAVAYDLPPAGEGIEKGELSALIAWYVTDERQPIRTPGNEKDILQLSEEERASSQRESDAIDRARNLGIRLMPVQRLLSSLGYQPGMVIPGGVEAQNRSAIDNILNPSGRGAALPGTPEFEQNRTTPAGDAP